MINNYQMISSSVSLLVATLIMINHLAFSYQTKTKSEKFASDNILRLYNKGDSRLKINSMNRFGVGDEALRGIDTSELPYSYRFIPSAKAPNLDTLNGASLGFDRKRSMDSMSGLTFGSPSKRNFDEIDNAGFGGFVKKNFDEIDRSGFNGFVKRNFDEIDRSGFGGFVRRRRDTNYGS